MLLWLGLLPSLLPGQVLLDPARQSNRQGNGSYSAGDYNRAESRYAEALAANPLMPEARYNLGGALYQLGRYDTAAATYEMAAGLARDAATQAQAYHNLGNARVKEGAFDKAVEAYKQALRLNPRDEDTRYNLAYAQEKLRQEQSQQDQQNQDEQDQENQDQNQDQQDQQDQEQNQDQQDQQQQDQQSQDEDQQSQEQNQQEAQPMQQMSEQELEQLLEAIRYQEEKLQEERMKQKVRPRTPSEKDW